MDFTRAIRTQNLIGAYISHRHIKLYALTEVILEFYK